MRWNRLLGSMVLLIAPGCGMLPAIPTTATTDTKLPPYVLCSLDPVISFHAPRAGEMESSANEYDSAKTIGDPKTRGTIAHHNAVVEAACNGGK